MTRAHVQYVPGAARAATLSLLLAVLGGCTTPPRPLDGRTAPAAGDIVLTLRPEQEFQTIHNFGASDAWSIQFVGKYWPEEKRNRIADLLFSTAERADGSPAGIGLSAWRFNIGAGSARQGNQSGIDDPWRRTESFMQEDGGYDWTRQAGQRAFLREARERGVEQFYAFVNSPPLPLTRNGQAHSSGGVSANVAAENYQEFAAFLRDVVVQVEKREGVRFDYLSPFNEPQWDWTGGQEGTPWTNAEMAAMVRTLSPVLVEGAPETEIEITEAGRYNYLYEAADKPARGEQIRTFFDPTSELYVGGLPNVAGSIAAHSYHTTFPADTLRAIRKRVHEEIQSIPGLELTQSEYCILADNSRIQGRGRDLGMDAALYVAGVIHSDLVDAGASAWQWWLAVSPYDYKDGLVYIDRDSLDGAVYESKILWTLGHYSRFIRPGMRRIDVAVEEGTSVNDTGADVLVSAYRDPASSRLVTVLTNRGSEPRQVWLEGPSASPRRLYRTSESPEDDLRLAGTIPVGEPISLPPRSLATVVSE